MKPIFALLLLCGTLACAQEVPLNEQVAREAPAWITNGIMYQINPRAFTPEGTLKAAEAKLPHISAAGATIVYLCPVFVADDDMNRDFWSPRQKASGMDNPRNPYRMKDYYHVDPEYGTDDDLRSFIKSAHALNLRVMLDMVYLHCGPKPVFLEEHPDFVKRDAQGNVQNAAWSFPGLNFESPELREYLWKNMEYWVTEFDADGFRMDVADGIALEFWEEARRRLEKIRPDIGMLAEGTRTRDQLYAFDLNYGFPFWGKVKPVFDKELPVSEIRKIKEEMARVRPRGARFMHCIDNHDISNDDYTGRVEKRWTEQGVEAALAMLYTLDGTPMLYCGQEICDTRRHSIFGNKNGCHIDWSTADSEPAKRRMAFCKKMSEMRLSRPELTSGSLVWLDNSVPNDVLSYARVLGERSTTIVINFRPRPASVSVQNGGETLALELKPFEVWVR